MSDQLRPFQPVGFNEIPNYPDELVTVTPATDYFVRWYHVRWLSSTMHLRASMAVQGMAINLFFYARQQNPMGSLPHDQDVLARLIRVSTGEWLDCMREPINQLHGWRQYRCGNSIVLGHPVVIAECLDALTLREQRALSNDQKAAATRVSRLAMLMGEMDATYQHYAKRQDVLVKLDEWLAQHHPGQRRKPQIYASIERGLKAGLQEGWV